jgi:predicted N-formylglutamate amidohydrolase
MGRSEDRVSGQYSGFTVVPGHGPISDTDGWKKLATYLRALRKGVADAVAAGQTREQAQESVNLEQFTWITDMGEFLMKKANIGWVYDELTQKR